MQALQTFLAYLLTIGVLITVHEYGHYKAAVLCGVRVFRFSWGFGRVVWSRRFGKDQCEFALSLLPLGGYVAMLEKVDATTPPEDVPRALESRPLWQRMVVVAAGPLANFVLAAALFAGSQFVGVQRVAPVLGTPAAGSLLAEAGAHARDRVVAAAEGAVGDEAAAGAEPAWNDVRSDEDIYENVAVALMDQRPLLLRLRAPDGASERTIALPLPALGKSELDADVFARLGLGVYVRPVLGRVPPGGPAARAGLAAGDLVTAVDGHPVDDRGELLQRIRASAQDGRPHPLQVQVLRAGRTLALTVVPEVVADGGKHFGRIEAEVGEPPAQELVRDGLGESLRFGLVQTWERAGLQLRLFGHMLTGRMSVKNLSGPISIADAAQQSISHGFMDFVLFLAEISVGLGVLNLLPLPVLDGGRLLYYLFEGATGRPVSALWQTRLQIGGVLAILLLMSLALSNDVARHLGQQ
jgi:regulator of sigma E protease